jgi:hypothetical protein
MSSFETTVPAAGRARGGWQNWAEKRWLVAAVYAVLALLALYPVFAVTVPPLVDYPNHLARMHILADAGGTPALQGNYVADWKLHPNMAMELIVPQLAQFLPIYMAGKVFIAASMLLLLGGTLALRKALHGRVGLWPVLAFLLVYNHILFWGFLDYLFTVGVALLTFSAWIALRERAAALRAAVFSVAALILFIGHLFGLFVYGVMVLGYELWRVRGHALLGRDMIRAWAVSGVQFAVPAALFLYWTATNGTGDAAPTEYGALSLRFIALISPVLFGMPWIDIPTAVFLAVVFALCRRHAFVGFAPEMIAPVLLLAVAALAMPHYLAGVWGTHFRIPTIIGCILVAGVRPAPEAGRFAMTVAAAAVAMVVLRTAVISHGWADLDRKFMEFRAASAAIEPGKRIFIIEDEADLPPGRIPVYGMQFWNLAALAVIERSVFLPTMFTGHVGIDAAPAVRHLDTPNGVPLSRDVLREYADPATSRYPLGHRANRYFWVYWTGWPLHYDYALSIRFANEANPDPSRLQRVARGSFFDIYRVAKPSPAAQ